MTSQEEEKKETDVLLYALSTCVMCGRVKKLLTQLSVEYKFIDVDLLDGTEKERIKTDMRKWHPRTPFPMLIVNNSVCIIGDEPEQIKKALGK